MTTFNFFTNLQVTGVLTTSKDINNLTAKVGTGYKTKRFIPIPGKANQLNCIQKRKESWTREQKDETIYFRTEVEKGWANKFSGEIIKFNALKVA